ncbi:GNAT family N-acetyltransferase [Streptomyces sp. NPDC049585]|uniref:GNAT family N-acetyltransferase n=1 Tax=Streptomyces sp. NPDC049585 TaxID=3155154 RepID=UPI00343F7372
MTTTIDRAAPADIADLRQLYYAVYGPHYPTALGTDPAEMSRLIADPHTLWLVARCARTGHLAGSAAIHGEPGSCIGRLEGLAVHPDHRAGGLAHTLTDELCRQMLETGRLDSVYATVRTVSAGPQRVVTRNGFKPLGVLPNAVDLSSRESLALYARHSPGVLDRRLPVPEVPAPLAPLLRTVDRTLGTDGPAPRATAPAPAPEGRSTARLEMVEAPAFVRRRFHERFPDATSWFYPLHTPNALLVADDGGFEVYAYLNRTGRYCALIAAHPSPDTAAGYLEAITRTLTRAGTGYVEALVPLAEHGPLSAFLAQGFIPSALYPAMRPDPTGAGFHDYVVMTRTAEQIDFRGVVVDTALQPYLDAYLSAWAATYLPTLEVAS